MTEALQQLVESIKDEVSRVQSELNRIESSDAANKEVASAELRGELAALRRVSVQIGGIIEQQFDQWMALYKAIS